MIDIQENSAFRQFEFEGWQKCADAYDSSFSPITLTVGETMLEVLGVGNGGRFLELACGPGHLSKRALDLGAEVTAVDFSPRMIDLAKERYTGITFQTGDAEALALEDSVFDYAAMNFGILHLGNPDQAVAEMRRVVKPGGAIAFSTWSPPTDALGFKVILDAVSAFGDRDVASPAAPSFFLFSDESAGQKVCEDAGLKFKGAQQVPLSWSFDSVEDFFNAFYDGTARTGGLLRAQDPKNLNAIKTEVSQELLRNFRGTKSFLEVPMSAKVYWAER